MKKLFLLCSMIVLLTACSDLQTPDTSSFGDGVPDYKQVRDDNQMIEGEMTDIADRNPNFLNLNNNGVGNVNNRGLLKQKLEETVESIDGFEPGLIYINGHDATVNVTAAENMTEADIENLERRLQLTVPRVEVHVRVNHNEEAK